MTLKLADRCAMRSRLEIRTTGSGPDARPAERLFGDGIRNQAKSDLPPPGKFDIDLHQKLGIEESPMFDPLTAIHAVAGA